MMKIIKKTAKQTVLQDGSGDLSVVDHNYSELLILKLLTSEYQNELPLHTKAKSIDKQYNLNGSQTGYNTFDSEIYGLVKQKFVIRKEESCEHCSSIFRKYKLTQLGEERRDFETSV